MSTINFQGFLQSGETESPFNGTISVRFYLHTQDEGPPDGIPLWEEFYSQLNVKDGIFFARLGVLNPLTRDLFRSDRPVQLSMRIVRFGTGEAASYIGPIAIDGNAYSVSSISKSGSDSKEGTVKIIPLAVDDPSSFGLLEIDSDDPETLHKFEIRWDKTGFPSADIGRGLVVQYPQNMELNSYAPSSSEDRLPWDSGQFLIDFQEEVPDISVYIVNGTVRLGGNLTLSPLEFDDFKLPGDLKAHNANVTGDIKVNDLIATGPGDGSGGIIKGTRLEYCAGPPDCQPKPGSSEAKFSNYGIDPFPAEDESKSTLINSLEIRSKLDDTGKLLFETDRGEFLIDGPLQTSQTSFVHVSGADGFVYASALRSPFPSKDKNGNISRPYVIAPDKISVLDSLVLITDTTNRNRDPKYPAFNEISKDRDALRSPLNAFSAFDLISTIPICSGVPTIAPYSAHCQETWCMALRPDYCAQDPNPKIRDKYKDIDPCHGISFNQLKGYRLNCRPEEIISDHPNLQTDENDPAKGAKYFVTSHIHQLLNNATAETLIEIINAAQAGQTLNKRLLPTDTVNLNLPNTLTGTNVFETVHSAHQMVASIDQDIDAYLGSFIVGLAQPARLGSLRTHISQIDFLKDLNTVGTLNLHAGSTILHTSADPARPQRHEVQKDVDVGGKLIVHSSVFETSGDLFFEDIDLDPANGPYMNFIGSVNLEGNLRFRPEEFQTNRNLLGLDQTIASKFIDLDDQSFSVDPDQYSTLSFLSVTGSFRVSKPSRVQGDLVIQRDLYAIESLESASFLKASTLSDLDDPHYFIDPPGTSRIRGLVVEESLTIQGDFTVDSTLRVTGVVDVSGSFFSSGKLEVQNPSSSVLSTYLEDSSDPKYKVDPTNQSLLRELGLNSSSNVGGDLSVDGQMEIQNTMTHEGSARVVGQVQSQDRILSPKLLDFEDSTYLADPSLQSRFHALELIKSLNVTNSTSLSSSLTILGELRSNSSLKILTDLIIGEDLTAFSSLQIYHTSGLGFSVDELGNATGRSITLDENAFAQDLEIGGNLNLSGTPIEFNADSSFEKLTISTHSLISRRSSTSLGFESAASIDKDGNLELHHELFLEDEMIISENIRFHDGNSPDRMVLSIVNSALTSVHIGLDGQKDLNLSGLSSKTLSVPTATFYRFEDSDNSAYHLDPASSTRFQILEIEHSLRTEESLTAPYLMDLQNLYLVDPSDKSRLLSLEVLQNTTAQQIQAASLRIDSQNLLPGSTLVEAGSMRITKGATLGLTGQTYLDGSNFLIGSSNGIRIADNRSLGSGSTITYGELNSLISGANADHLHRHDLLGGVEIYNIARQDIDNLTGPTPQTTSSTKGLFGKNLFTYPGLTISIRPVSHQTQSALFSVKDSSGSAVVQAFASGLVEAVTFQGAGQGLSNISGSGTSNDAISDGTIASDKIQNNSLGGSVFATQLLQLSHLKDRALEAKHFLERSLDANVIEDGSLVGENFRDDSIENLHLTSATIDTTLIENGSISSYHIKTRTISASHISPSTLDNRVLQSASVLGDRIIDGSIQARHVSTGAVNTTRITTNELQGSLFEDNSISTVKIQTAAIQTSSFASLSLTYSDFATNSILSSKVASSSITGSNFASGTLDSSALAANSINWIKISSLSLQAVDISTLAIQSSSEATQHKVNLAAINSDKILDREVEGSHFIADSILLSHLAANAVSSTHFQTQSILGEDILTGTLSGLKINDLSIQTAQIGDQAITKSEIASSALDSNSIANLTLSSESFQDGSIIRSKLASDTVASLHLRNSSLLDKDFALNALTQSKWKSDTINTIKIATGAITLQKLATGAVRSQEVSYRAVLTSAISASAILSTHILSNQVTQSKIANFTILVEDIGDAQIDVRIVAPDSILTTNILDLSVFSPHISTNALSGAILSEDAITRAKVLSDQIDSAQILDGSIFSGNFSTSAILSNHIDLDTLSSRVLGTAQVLTTHVAEGAIGNSRIQTDQINSRILTQSSVIARHILTHTLGSSKFASSILTDEHFQDGAISPSKIATDSLVETVFLSYTLLGIHVIPSSLTSGSLEDLAITSSQISNDTISGEHILELSLTDLELATDALDNSVFQIDAISSPNVLDESILSQDIATGALLSTHIAAGTLLDEHFAPSSILTTHIANFTIGSGVLQSSSVTQAKFATRTSITRGFHSLSDTAVLSDATSMLYRDDGSFLFFSPTVGTVEITSLSTPFQRILDSQRLNVSLSAYSDGRVWAVTSTQLLGSFFQGSALRLLKNEGSTITHISLEDRNHGALISSSNAYLTYDGGENFRLVRSGSNFLRVYSRSEFSDLWVLSSDGSLAYTTDSFKSLTSLAVPASASPIANNSVFTMTSSSTGFLAAGDRIYKTSNNWQTSTSSSSIGSFEFAHIDEAGNTVALLSNGTIKQIDPDLNISVQSFSLFSNPAIEVAIATFSTTSTFSFLFSHSGESDKFLAFTSDGGASYSLASMGTSNQDQRAEISFSAHSANSLYLSRGNEAYYSTDSGQNWNSVSLSPPLSRIGSLIFTTASTGFATFLEGGTGSVYKTLNSGSDWTKTSLEGLGFRADMVMKDNNSGWVLGFESSTIFGTVDAFNSSTSHSFPGISFEDLTLNGSTAYFVSNSLIAYSSNPQSTPQTLSTTPEISWQNIAADGTGGVFLASSSAVYHFSTPGAEGINLNYPTINSSIQDLCSLDQFSVLAAATGSDTYLTRDKGITWDRILPLEFHSRSYSTCHFEDAHHLFLGTPDEGIMVARLGKGVEGQRIALGSMDNSLLQTGFEGDQFIDESLSGSKLQNASLDSSKLQSRSILSDNLTDNLFSSTHIQDGVILTRILADQVITLEKIALESIDGTSKIAQDVLTSGDFSDLSIDYELIQSNSLDAQVFTQTPSYQIKDEDFLGKTLDSKHLAYRSFSGALLEPSTLNSTHLEQDSVLGFHFQTGTITPTYLGSQVFSPQRMLPFSISQNSVVDGSLTSNHLALSGSWNEKIQTGAITSTRLVSDSLDETAFSDRAIITSLIGNASVTYRDLSTQTLYGSQFQSSSISGSDFKLKSITEDKIQDGAIDASTISTESVKGEFVISGEILSSKIPSQAISGIHLVTHTLGSNRLQDLGFSGVDVASNTLTQSKIQTRTLTDGHFQNLEDLAFAQGSFGNSGIRLYQTDSTSFYVSGRTDGKRSQGAHDLSTYPNFPRLSHDGTRVAFLKSGTIFHSDWNYAHSVNTGITYPGTPEAFFVWKSDDSGFFYFDDSDDSIYFYDIHARTKSVDTALPTTASDGTRLVFSEDRSRWAILSGGTITASDGNCSVFNTGMEHLGITPSGSKIFGVASTQNDFKFCDWGGAGYTSKDFGGDARYPNVDPTDSSSVYFFIGTTLVSTTFSNFSTHIEHLNTDLSTDAQLLHSYFFPSHVLDDRSLNGSKLLAASIQTTHISSLGIAADAFNAGVIYGSHLQTDSITSGHIQATTLSESVVGSAEITSGHLEELTLTGDHFTENSIDSNRILTLSISGDRFQNLAVLQDHFNQGSIISSKVSLASILTTHIADRAVTTNTQIQDDSISTTHLITSEIISEDVINGSILTTHIVENSIQPIHLVSGSILHSNLDSEILSNAHFGDGVVLNEHLKNSAIDVGDGFIVTIESGDIFRYDFDGANRTELLIGNWSNLQRTANYNSITAVSDTTAWDIDPFASTQLRPLDIPGAQNILRVRDSNLSYAIGGDHWKTMAPMISGGRRSMAAGVIGGKVYLAGGHKTVALDRLESYDPKTDQWSVKTPMPEGERRSASGAVVNGIFYVFGGHDGNYLDRVEAYDPATNTWRTKTPMPGGARRELRSEAVNGKIYVIGGYNGSSLDRVEEYDPSSDTWTTKTPMGAGAREDHDTAVVGGKIYVFGGKASNTALTRLERYDPSTDSWTTLTSIPGSARRELAVAEYNQKIYLFGGYTDTDQLATVLEYDPVADSYRSRASLGEGERMEMSAFSHNDRIYVIGGTQGSANVDVNERYIPGESDHLITLSDSEGISQIGTAATTNGIDLYPSNGKLAYVTNSGSNYYLTEYDGTDTSVRYTAANPLTKPRYKSGGSQVYFVETSGGSSTLKLHTGISANSIFNLPSNTIDDIQTSLERDRIYYQLEGDLWIYDNGQHTRILDSPGDSISEFEILPYSIFNEGEISARVGASAVTTAIWVSRILTSGHFATGAIDSDDLALSTFGSQVFQNSAITEVKFRDSSLITGAVIASDAITSGSIVNASILTSHIDDDTLTSRSFATSNLTSQRLTGTISASKIKPLTLVGLKFAENTVSGLKIETGSIHHDLLTSFELGSREVLDGTIAHSDLATESFLGSLFQSRAITGGHIKASQITSSIVKALDLNGSLVATEAITYGKIPTATITTTLIPNAGIPGTFLDNRTLTNSSLSSRIITSGLISSASVTGANLGNALTTSSLALASLTAGDFLLSSFPRDVFTQNSVTDSLIQTASLNAAVINSGAITSSLITTSSIPGESLANSAILTAHLSLLTFDTSHFNSVFKKSHIDSLSLTGSQFSSATAEKLTTADFSDTVVDTENVADSSISSDELASSAIVLSAGSGLRLTSDQILLAHFQASSLTGRVLSTGALKSENFSASSLSTSKIDDGSLLGSRIETGTLSGYSLAPQAILSTHIPDGEITENSIADSTFQESSITEITGKEIKSLTGSSIQALALTRGEITGGLTNREVDAIEAANLQNTTFGSSSFGTGVVTRGHFNTSAGIQISRFLGSQIPADRIQFNSLSFSKLNTDDAEISDLFFENNADSRHTHEILTQVLVCPAGSDKINGGGASIFRGSSFCLKGITGSDTLSNLRDSADANLVESRTVRAQICTMDQLWKATKQGENITSSMISSNFILKTKGFGGSLKVLRYGTLTNAGTGTVEEEDVNNADAHGAKICF